eukprot:Nk52_evm1s1253 gene=Nk52_evmTU1s1253
MAASAKDIQNALEASSKKNEHVGMRPKQVKPEEELFNKDEPRIKEDIIRMIIQYLQNEGYVQSNMVLQDEANVKFAEHRALENQMKRMKKAILEGDWQEVEKLCSRYSFKNQKVFLYAVYRQQYLELIEKREYQKAFTYLTKRLKPVESVASHAEFMDLCYLLTCRSVQDSPAFRFWEGIGPSRESLIEQFQHILDSDIAPTDSSHLEPDRLLHLLRQACSYQVEFSRYHPKLSPKINTLLKDFSSFVVPNRVRNNFIGHTANVKCIEFVGEDGLQIASGSSDNTVIVWDTESGKMNHKLSGHRSRIWDLASDRNGDYLVSCSADSTVKLWDLKAARGAQREVHCTSTLQAHTGDVYSVSMHPGSKHVASGGYDKNVNLLDIRSGATLKTFSGHELSVCTTTFNYHGNLIISGSKDSTVKFWDIVSGLCVFTIGSGLGEVTSLAVNKDGNGLLIGCKDNSNRLWDMRMLRSLKRFRGHQNTSKNFIKAGFGPTSSLISSGSEDGIVHIWDVNSGTLVQRLRGHEGIVYSSLWNAKQSLLASCSDDGIIKTWWYDERYPLFNETEE